MERERYRIRDLDVDVGAASVTRDGGDTSGDETLHLPQLSFDLLIMLIRQAPNVVSADELVAEVWRQTAVADETVVQRVALLRRALGDSAKDPIYVRSVRGRGYQLVPEVEEWTEAPTANAVDALSTSKTPWRGPLAIAAALVLVLGGWLTYQSIRPGSSDAALVTQRPGVPELLERAETYLQRQQETDNEIAVELFEKALALEPDQPDALAGLSLALSHQITKFNRPREAAERAVRLARQAIDLEPGHARAHQALGLALDSRGRTTQALEAYARSYEIDPRRTDALASAANLLQVGGRLAEALEANVRVLRSGDQPAYLEVQMGATLDLLGFDEAAEIWFERALELRPNNVFAALGLARMRLSQGRLDEADEAVDAGLERGVRRSELWIIRGDVAWLRGDRDRARDAYQEAKNIQPGVGRPAGRLLLLDLETSGKITGEEIPEAQIEVYRRHVAAIQESRATGNEWPIHVVDEAALHTAFGLLDEATGALDVAIDLGFRDADGLLHDPTLTRLRGMAAFQARLERIRLLVQAERQRVLDADWLPPSLLGATAGPPASNR